ncbi:zinc finger BED domain-containing protein 4-like [Acyrthosiphon pisum]|uniref:Zinc finger BED domain-containing protein 4 n=1 Tax=Acyrthosiphon pisum TaxID=7029 RepID=A0A8R2FEA9_ACYPI|nr:zinc finger BED domain-containing protein 4-like [Acyrthosiphon pisum]|eukprot:XP_008189983.1 PREDICTED: zinc finger BED domain-containing protein 4-like [Acyrthosiphon pisum]
MIQMKPVTTLLRCAAHSLQLCVEDTLKTDAVHSIVTKAREVVKKLRTPTVARMVKSLEPNSLKAILDVPTRWGSTYDMLLRLHRLRKVCNDLSETYKELCMNNDELNMIDNAIKSFEPAKIATVKVQTENLTIGDFHGIWIKCYEDTKLVNSIISNILCNSMNKREKILFGNNIYSAGVFLDPRYQCLLDESTKHQAKSHLIDVFNLMNALSSENSDQSKTFISQYEEPKTHVTHVNDTDDSLEAYIRNKTNVALENNRDIENLDSSKSVPIRLLLESYDGTSRLHNSVDVRNYWEKEKNSKPELYKLAQLLLNVPVTQV